MLKALKERRKWRPRRLMLVVVFKCESYQWKTKGNKRRAGTYQIIMGIYYLYTINFYDILFLQFFSSHSFFLFLPVPVFSSYSTFFFIKKALCIYNFWKTFCNADNVYHVLLLPKNRRQVGIFTGQFSPFSFVIL